MRAIGGRDILAASCDRDTGVPYSLARVKGQMPQFRTTGVDGFSVLHQVPADEPLELDFPGLPDIAVLFRLSSSFRRDGRQAECDVAGPLKPFRSHAGKSLVAPAGVPSRWRIPAGIGNTVQMYLSPALASALLADELHGRPLEFAPRLAVADQASAQVAGVCLAEIAQPGPASDLLLQSCAMALAVRLFRAHSTLPQSPMVAALAMAPYRLSRACAYIDAHLSAPIRLTDIAAAAGLSPHHFARAFKATTGMSPYRMVVERRIERAKRLLGDGALPLAQVALDCGFASQQQFTVTFHKVVGMTPGRWRRSYRL